MTGGSIRVITLGLIETGRHVSFPDSNRPLPLLGTVPLLALLFKLKYERINDVVEKRSASR